MDYGGDDNFVNTTEGNRPVEEVGGVASDEGDSNSVGNAGIGGEVTLCGLCSPAGRYLVRWLLQLNKLHIDGDKRAGWGGGRGKMVIKGQTNRVLKVTEGFKADVTWKR